MNKLFLLPVLFLALMSSCAKSSENSENDESNASGSSNSNGSTTQLDENDPMDNYTKALAELMSVGARKQFEINDQNGDPIDRQAFIDGIKTVLKVDTADIAFLYGLEIADNFYSEARNLAKADNLPLDVKLLKKDFKSAFNDSVMYEIPDEITLADFGQASGAQIRQMIDSAMSNEQFAKKFNKESFFEGFDAAFGNTDNTFSRMDGISAGISLFQRIMQMEDMSKKSINREALLNHFVKSLDSDINEKDAFRNIQKATDKVMAMAYEPNIKKGKEYAQKMLAQGYQSSPSGLVYKIEKQGSADRASDNSNVKLNYVGKHIDGTEFDSSDEPISLSPNRVVKGFGEALKMVGKGGKIKVVIPYDLAYGEGGAAPVIEPYETLVFDIEVFDIE